MKANAKNVRALAQRKEDQNYDLRRYFKEQGELSEKEVDKDNRCTVYEDRPQQCRKYPYLYEPRFCFRTLAMIERTFTCPVVYQVFEELKAELPFRRRSRNGWQ